MYDPDLMESTTTLPEAAKSHWFKLRPDEPQYRALSEMLQQFDLQLVPDELPVSIGPAVRDVPAFGDSTHSGVCAHVVIHARYIFNRRTGFTERLDNNIVKYCAFSQESDTTVGGLHFNMVGLQPNRQLGGQIWPVMGGSPQYWRPVPWMLQMKQAEQRHVNEHALLRARSQFVEAAFYTCPQTTTADATLECIRVTYVHQAQTGDPFTFGRPSRPAQGPDLAAARWQQL